MNAFSGKWKDESGRIISVAVKENIATLQYNSGRGPFTGFELDLASSVINVDFYDLVPLTGMLTNDGDSIYWSDRTVWNRLG